MFNKKTLVAAVTLSALVATGCATGTSYSDADLSLRKQDVTQENTVVPAKGDFKAAGAGESKVFERAYENAPPMISHDVDGMLPITRANNACLGCHAPEVAPAVKATPVPKTHLATFRPMTEYVDGTFKKGGKAVNNTADIKTTITKKSQVSFERYNCSQCHAPQANVAPIVANEFKPDFRAENGIARSNLIDTLNEGVK